MVLPKDVGKIMGNMMIHQWILGVCSMLVAESDIPFLLGNLNDKSLIKGSFMEETPSYGWVLFSVAPRSLCPDGVCLRRSWSHILTSPDHCVQLACAFRDHEVTFSLTQNGTWSPVVSCDCIVFCKSFWADRMGSATSWMDFECQDLHETPFFRVNEGSVARRSLCRGILLEMRAQWNWGFQVTFSLLCCCCAIVLCMCWDTLCIGTGASQRCVLR